MIALDTNVLVRYLVADDPEQSKAARGLMHELSAGTPGFICREVMVELVWVLDRSYDFSMEVISTTLVELLATEGIVVETADDVALAVLSCRRGGADFSDMMIAAASRRAGARSLYTLDRRAARLQGVELLEADNV